jgi:hypothetical protein
VVPRGDGPGGRGGDRRGAGLRHHGDRRGRPRPAAGGHGAAPGHRPSWSCSRRWSACGPGRPTTPPMLGPAGPTGLVVATGHYRNGILLTPVTADAGGRAAGHRPGPRAHRPVRARGGSPAGWPPRWEGGCRDRDRQRPAGRGRRRPDRGRPAGPGSATPPAVPASPWPATARWSPAAPGPPPAWTQATGWRCSAPPKEDEQRMDDALVDRGASAVGSMSPPDPLVIAGRAFGSRLIMGTGGGGQSGGPGAGPGRLRDRADHRGPAPHQPAGPRGRSWTSCGGSGAGCCPTPPAASPPATPSARPTWPGRRSAPTGSSSRSSATTGPCSRTRSSSATPPRPWSTTASVCSPTPTTTRCWPVIWPSSGAPRSCRWGRPSGPAWASVTPTTCASSSSRRPSR